MSLKFITFITILILTAMAAPCQADPSLEQMAGQMVMVGFRGTALDPDQPVYKDLEQGLVGGVILFNRDLKAKSDVRNITSPEQLRTLCGQLKKLSPRPLLIAVDQEGGKVARLNPKNGFPATNAAGKLGKMGKKSVFRQAAMTGDILKKAGINVDFAPVVDLDYPDSPAIGALGRSFSANPETVYTMAKSFIAGLNSRGVISCLKHFPGHGSATGDTHLGYVDVSETWTEKELVPYRLLIRDGFDQMVMTAHIYNSRLDRDNVSTVSQKTVTGILRRRLGFAGVVVSDDIQMKAIAGRYSLEQIVLKALNAGVDIVLAGNNLDYDPEIGRKIRRIIIRLVKRGKISDTCIKESYNRIIRLKTKWLVH